VKNSEHDSFELAVNSLVSLSSALSETKFEPVIFSDTEKAFVPLNEEVSEKQLVRVKMIDFDNLADAWKTRVFPKDREMENWPLEVKTVLGVPVKLIEGVSCLDPTNTLERVKNLVTERASVTENRSVELSERVALKLLDFENVELLPKLLE
jgi:hypothetical protein